MKTTRPDSYRSSAFTLIELLVVITIISVLVGIAMPAIIGAFRNARILDTRNTLTGLVSAINNYYGDNNRLPLSPGKSTDSEIELTSGNELLKVLLGENVNKLNPATRSYIEDPQMGKGGAGGLVGREGSYSLVDRWGQPYRVVLDGNYDDRIANPDARNEDATIAGEAAANLPRRVGAYSAGPDKKFGTRDDITTWR